MPIPALIIAPTDFGLESIGGTSSIIEEVLACIDGSALSPLLVGAREQQPARRQWTKVDVGGKERLFLPVSGQIRSGAVPARLALAYGLWRARHLLKKVGAGVVYAHCPEAVLAARCVLPRVPVVFHVHGTASPLEMSRFKWARQPMLKAPYELGVMRRALRAAVRILVTSDATAFETVCARWGAANARKAVRIPAMVNTEIFAPPADRASTRRRVGLEGQGAIIVSVGRIERTKGVGDVVAAFRLLRERGGSAKLVIIGDGSYKQELETCVRSAQLASDVMFTGALSRAEVAGFLSGADVFVSGSWQEGFSLALLEALACGLTPAVTDVGGVRELVTDGKNGFIAKPRDVEGLAGAMQRALEMRSGFGGLGRERALMYSSSRIAERIIADLVNACATLPQSPQDAPVSGDSYKITGDN